MAHLAKMLAVAAAGCSHERSEPATVTLPPIPPASASAAPTAKRVVEKRPPPDEDDFPQAVRHPMHGYDPAGPPPPQYCAAVAAGAHATVALAHGPSGAFDIDVHVRLATTGAARATFAPPRHMTAAQTVHTYGGVTLSASLAPTVATARARLNMIASAATVSLWFPLVCPPGSGSLAVFVRYDRQAGTVSVDRIESR